jgi:D(-)-tartrate dehydratase
MRITEIHERAVPISRYQDPSVCAGLTTSAVAVVTDVIRGGKPIIGYGFSSVGRFAQSGLIRERFAPRLLAASDLSDRMGSGLDPVRAWSVMLANEKAGGHGERCVAVGTLDMALWDAAAKIENLPLYALLSQRLQAAAQRRDVQVYAAGGYYYPTEDIHRLSDEIRRMQDHGFTRFKIKIGTLPIDEDLKRIDAVLRLLPSSDRLAVDAMNAYDATQALQAASALTGYGLWWFEDVCDPLDFDTLSRVASSYAPPIAAGEALFSESEARLLDRHGGLRRDRDILVFDPVHCYGLTGYLRIISQLDSSGWQRSAFWPHGGHLFSLHVVAALGLAGAEVSPFSFQPFCGLTDNTKVVNGAATPPDAPGVGFELKQHLKELFCTLLPS